MFLLSCYVSLPCAVGWPMVGDCAISWSYSLAFGFTCICCLLYRSDQPYHARIQKVLSEGVLL